MICLRNFPQSNLSEQQTAPDHRESAHLSNQDLRSPHLKAAQSQSDPTLRDPPDPRTLEIPFDLPLWGHIKTLAGWCSPSLQEGIALTFLGLQDIPVFFFFVYTDKPALFFFKAFIDSWH